jgi:hypothetical protein
MTPFAPAPLATTALILQAARMFRPAQGLTAWLNRIEARP